MSEQESQPTPTAGQASTMSACPHPEAIGKRWGDPIDEELQVDLQNYLDQWAEEPDHGSQVGPFQKVKLSGADVFWLAERVRNAQGAVPDLHLEGAILTRAHLEGANLAEAHLERANITQTHLHGARLGSAHLEHADLRDADLTVARLKGANLRGANLQGANGIRLGMLIIVRLSTMMAPICRVWSRVLSR